MYVSHTLKGVQLLNLSLLHGAIAVCNGYLHAILQGATVYTTYGDTTLIARIVERCDEHLRCSLLLLWGGDHLYDFIKQISDIVGRFLPVLTHPAVLSRTINHGEIQLLLGGIEREHQIEYHLVNLLRAAVRLIHLVNYNDRLQADFECLLQHETCLRHRTFEGINQQQAAIGHVEHTLYLATEIRVSWSVDDIDFNAFPIDTDVF